MLVRVLEFGFLVIFFATAIIGIASIPNWIKIPEWYRKKIFIVLILEVVGVIFIIFKEDRKAPNPEITIEDKNWIALNDSGLIVKPKITIKTKDTTITKQIGRQSYKEFNNLSGKMVKNSLSIINSDTISLCTINALGLKKSGLFNSFKTAKNEIISTENYAYIKWEKPFNGRWKKKGKYIEPFDLEVVDYSEGTYYRIRNNVDRTILFDSRVSSKNLFSVDNRIVHFFEYEDIYYLLRITWADLLQQKKYLHVINIRLEPTIKEK